MMAACVILWAYVVLILVVSTCEMAVDMLRHGKRRR